MQAAVSAIEAALKDKGIDDASQKTIRQFCNKMGGGAGLIDAGGGTQILSVNGSTIVFKSEPQIVQVPGGILITEGGGQPRFVKVGGGLKVISLDGSGSEIISI